MTSPRDASVTIQARCCFIKFLEDAVLPISLHMTNTVFIDRAIIVQVTSCPCSSWSSRHPDLLLLIVTPPSAALHE